MVSYELNGVLVNREVYHRKESAAALLIDKNNGKVYLTQQFRLPVYLAEKSDEQLIECCAGMIDKGETPEECMIREIEEEMGYRVDGVEKIAEAFYSPAILTEKGHLFISYITPEMKVKKGGGIEDEGEQINTVEFTAEELKFKLKNAAFKDAKTIILIQHALLYNLI